MRVEEDVRHHSTFGKGHVFSWPQSAQDAFLSMTAGKFVSNCRIPGDSESDAYTLESSSSSIITAYLDVIYNTSFLIPGKKGKSLITTRRASAGNFQHILEGNKYLHKVETKQEKITMIMLCIQRNADSLNVIAF